LPLPELGLVERKLNKEVNSEFVELSLFSVWGKSELPKEED
jgi:hypothetical protein